MRWTWDQFGIGLEASITERQRGAIEFLVPQQTVAVILEKLRLTDIVGVEVEFYEAIQKAVVMVAAKVVNPTWREIEDASRASGWSVEVFASATLPHLRLLAYSDFNSLEPVGPALAKTLVDHGFLTLHELMVVDPEVLMQIGGLEESHALEIIRQADLQAER